MLGPLFQNMKNYYNRSFVCYSKKEQERKQYDIKNDNEIHENFKLLSIDIYLIL